MTAPTTHSHGLRKRDWPRFLRAPDARLLDELYVPALKRAVRYDRCCAYFSSHVLAVAARGFGGFIANLCSLGDDAKPAARLLVNEQLDPDDLEALLTHGDDTPLVAHLLKRFRTPTEALEKNRLAMLAWLVATGWLEVRVGVLRRTGGLLHAKFGLITDAHGDSLAFMGSDNETGQALVENYEELSLAPSWMDPEFVDHYRARFETLWEDRDDQVTTLPLPEAVRLELIKLAPKEPPAEMLVSVEHARATMVWHFVAAAPYLPTGDYTCDATSLVPFWLHQQRVVEDVTRAFPAGRLLCDEVGMGKTIEAIGALRRLLAGRGVKRALLLVPAGLLRQWQDELREKGGLLVPYWERGCLVHPDRSRAPAVVAAALATCDLLLLSREWARLESNRALLLASEPWDLVLLDEAHAARRRAQVEGEFNSGNLLLDLLRQLQLRRQARSLMLLSATPMQTQPWEPWDLLTVLGVGGPWMADFADIRAFYDGVASLSDAHSDRDALETVGRLVRADPEFPAGPPGVRSSSAQDIAQSLIFAKNRSECARWLRLGAPLGRRMHRNTRDTLRQYHRMGLLEQAPPVREVQDVVFDYQERAERECYNAITQYIDRRYDELESEKPGKGFVMTIYRRRAASSPYALRRSLEHRLEKLDRVIRQQWNEDVLGEDELGDTRDLIDADLDEQVDPAVPSDPEVAAKEKAEVQSLLHRLRELGNVDSKLERFWDVLREATSDGRSALVFTEYVDTMNYLRDSLRPSYGEMLGCYSGSGGQLWDGSSWVDVTKNTITERLAQGKLRVLVCTDAASEGLNLQDASALINYDLPWNPSKVEQRIGRIDRIGQKQQTVRIRNLFLQDSVDMRVYEVLRHRCGLFVHFVGKMQPVLSKARDFLRANPSAANIDELLRSLQEKATAVERDAALMHAFVEAEAEGVSPGAAPVTREDLIWAMELLEGLGGSPRAQRLKQQDTWRIIGLGRKYSRVGATSTVLEMDRRAVPLVGAGGLVEALAGALPLTSRMPLIVGEYASGPFRATEVRWVGQGGVRPVESMTELRQLLCEWEGNPTPPSPGLLAKAEREATETATLRVKRMERQALREERAGLERQLEAARRRLLRELARTLRCISAGDLDKAFRNRVRAEQSLEGRYHRALQLLGAYPAWPPEVEEDASQFVDGISNKDRVARIAGSEIDAALNDPRWAARGTLEKLPHSS